MKNFRIMLVIEYLSLILILSYFLIHNIYMVLIGISFSIYLININLINSCMRYISKKLFSQKASIDLNKNYKLKKSIPDNIKIKTEDSKLSLVETIEELGFIPSIDKNNDSNAA